MSKPLIVVTADTHLAPRAWARYTSLEGDAYYSFSQIVKYCNCNDLPLVIAGDVFDKTRPDPATVFKIRHEIDLLELHENPLYYIQGQHELDRANPWLNAISAHPIHINNKAVILSCQTRMYGIDWQPSSSVHTMLADVPGDTHILVMHQVWANLQRIGDSECKFEDVGPYRMLITGDQHRHLVLTPNTKSAPTTVLSPGAISMQSIDENPNKQFFVVYDDFSIVSIPLITRKCYRVNINTNEELEIFLTGNIEQICKPQENVPHNICRNIVDITYNDEIPEIYARIVKAIGFDAHIFMIPKRHKDKSATNPVVNHELSADNMDACLALSLAKDSSIYGDMLSLLKSPDPASHLSELHNRFLTNNGIVHNGSVNNT